MSPNVARSRASIGITRQRKMPPSRKVLQAVLFTSLLWLGIDVVLLTTYSHSSDSSNQNSVKLPGVWTNNIYNRNNHERIVGNNRFLRGNNLGIGIWNRMLGRAPDSNKQGIKVSVAEPVPKDLPDSASSDSQRSHSSNRTKQLHKPLLDKLRNKNERVLNQNQHLDGANVHVQDSKLHAAHNHPNETSKISSSPENMTFHFVKNLDVTTVKRNLNAPGENGKGTRANAEDKALVQQGWKHASFNEFVSDMISVERSIKDTRPSQCKRKMIADRLPTTSIIICFTEESWSTLLRTVHSVINRSPPELVKEVLLIDDFSQRDYLKEPLDKYMKRFPKVRIIRLPKREGLIRARIRGADQAKGDVLTFLDSHVECNVGWLEPLLHRIWEDRRNVVCPVIDGIDSDSFSYDGAANGIVGAFTWDMQFRWQGLPTAERNKHRKDESSPLSTPAMAGGLFSIARDYFYELGTYDPGFDIWGAENLELSFKVWMCGGQLEILPCSRVGHIFRKTQPYKFPGGNVKTFLRNTQRMVEVWLDDYKDIFYKLRPELQGQSFGNITDRLLLKKRLGCHNFKWYLDHVFPSLEVPETKFQATGEVRNMKLDKCMDTMGKSGPVSVFPCHGKGYNQNFALTWKGKIQFETTKCLSSIGGVRPRISITQCSGYNSMKFTHTKNEAMYHPITAKCLDVNELTNQLLLRHCDGSTRQKWQWKHYYHRDGSPLS